MKHPPGWVGAGRIKPAPAKEKQDPCIWCAGTGKNYRNAWDLQDAMYPDPCFVCDGTGKRPDHED